MSTPINDTVINSYLETLIWSESLVETLTYEGIEYTEGSSLQNLVDSSDLKDGPLWQEAADDLEGFRTSCLQGLGIDPFTFFDACGVAHNFVLSRNGHGAGFFDSVWKVITYSTGLLDVEINLAQGLHECAKQSGTHSLMVWVDKTGALKVGS